MRRRWRGADRADSYVYAGVLVHDGAPAELILPEWTFRSCVFRFFFFFKRKI